MWTTIIILILIWIGSRVSKNKIQVKNRPLPNRYSEKYNVSKFETREKIHLPDDVINVRLNLLAQITYTDVKGQVTERRITIKCLYELNKNDYLIQSYCHERKAERTFKLFRISKIIDMETGEIFTEPYKYFIDRFHDSPLGLITKCFQELEAEILVLTFVARADGYLRKKERDIIISFITQKTNSNLDLILLEDEIRRTYCDNKDFRNALKVISKKTEVERQLIMNTANNIVATDKKTDPMEIGILDLIKKESRLEQARA